MATKYAKDQPAGFTNRIERVAIVGGGGQQGKYVVEELLRTGKHTITALTRPNSTNKIPDGVKIAHINYDDESTLVKALQGQQFLIVILSVEAPREYHTKLAQAAAKAKVPYVMPNCWGYDLGNEKLCRESIIGDGPRLYCAEVAELGVSSWVAIVCSLWYEYSMVSGPAWLGFDMKEKKAIFYDDGNTKINLSTWEQCARAAAALVSLKELPEDENDQSTTLSQFLNRPTYISSFRLSQKDMFESWKRVTGQKDEEWTIEYEPSIERYNKAMEAFKGGDQLAVRIAAFTRVFFQNGDGDYETRKGLDNEALGLPVEDLDERTRIAKQLSDRGYNNWNRV